jgi:hypothetical protein
MRSRSSALAFILVPLATATTAACVQSRSAQRASTETVATRAESLPPAPPPAETATSLPESMADREVARDDKDIPAASAAPMAPAPRTRAAVDSLGGLSAFGRGGGASGESAAAGAPAAVATGGFWNNQAASIAAGEWNDNANYREFQKWLVTETSVPFRHVDVSRRRFLVVRDESGRAVPDCQIDVTDSAEHSVGFLTGASGRAVLFPRAEGLADGVTATARCDGGTATRTIALDDSDGLVDLRLPVSRQLPETRTIDVAFILDTTGSMSEEITSVKSTIAKVAAGLGDGNVAVRIGLVEYKDRGDSFVTRVHPFSSDAKGFAQSVSGISAGGGGDTPESVNEGIHVALTGLDWQTQSVGRFAFLIGDAPPHLDYQQDYSYAQDMKTASHRGIQIFTVAASGMDVLGQVVWRQIAQYTGASNMFVLRGGAGPQSTGAGDPRASCGGTHQNYSSGNLDALILGKIRGERHALDGDPMRIAGLHEDEDAKPCDQRIGMQ